MIYCTVLTGPEREPAEIFIQATDRFVCVPDESNSVLAVSVDRPAFMQVMVDEEVVLAAEVTPEAKHFELQSLLTRKSKDTRIHELLKAIHLEHDSVERPARTFTVVFRDGGEHDHIVAFYKFHLLEAAAFYATHRAHFDLVEGVRTPSKFTTDARSPETAQDCWNCGVALKAGITICPNCGASQNDQADKDR